MEDSNHTYTDLVALKNRLEATAKESREQTARLESELKSVIVTLDLLQRNGHTKVPLEPEMQTSVSDLQGLTQLQALVTIAKAKGNRIKLSYARQMLLKAGLTKSPKNATNILFNVIQKSGKFKRVASGMYELIGEEIRS